MKFYLIIAKWPKFQNDNNIKLFCQNDSNKYKVGQLF